MLAVPAPFSTCGSTFRNPGPSTVKPMRAEPPAASSPERSVPLLYHEPIGVEIPTPAAAADLRRLPVSFATLPAIVKTAVGVATLGTRQPR